eukprot:gene19663-biopygen39957
MDVALAQLQTYATTNRLAPEPTKTQLMITAGSARLREVAKNKLVCTMAGQEIPPRETIKVLGVLLDDRLSWEQHNAAAAGRALNAARTVKRACRHIRGYKDRGKFLRALAHPHLDYCQNALVGGTAQAEQVVRRAYNRTARIAVMSERSAPALAKLRWPTWERRRTAARAAFTQKIWVEGDPPSLRELLPEAVNPGDGMQTRAMLRGEVPEPAPRNAAGEKAFRIWGPRVINQVARDDVFEDCSSEEDWASGEPPSEKSGKMPSDPYELQRKTFYAELIISFQAIKYFE